MTIEFKKETDLKETWYFTTVDKMAVSGTFSKDKDEAYKLFLLVVENEGQTKKTEILETIIK